MLLAHKHRLKAIALFNCLLNHAGGKVTNKIYIDTVFFLSTDLLSSFVQVLSFFLQIWLAASYLLSFDFKLTPFNTFCGARLLIQWILLLIWNVNFLFALRGFWNIEFLVDYFDWLWFLVFVFYETESQYLADGPEMDSKTDSNVWRSFCSNLLSPKIVNMSHHAWCSLRMRNLKQIRLKLYSHYILCILCLVSFPWWPVIVVN